MAWQGFIGVGAVGVERMEASSGTMQRLGPPRRRQRWILPESGLCVILWWLSVIKVIGWGGAFKEAQVWGKIEVHG